MAKQGLTKSGFKDQIGLKLERTRREEKGKREKKRKKKKKERRSSQASQRYGNYLEYGFCMDHMNFKALYG